MTSGTIIGSTSNEYIDSRIEWSSTANISTNSSSIIATLQYKRNNTGFQTYGTGNFSITINGRKTSVTKALTITENEWVTAVSATITVNHNEDGAKSIVIKGEGGMSGTTLTSTSCSDTVKLDTIARASIIDAVSNRYLGEYCAVKWKPLSKSFRYKLKFSMGNWAYTTNAIHPNQTSNYLYTAYLIPLNVAVQIPNSLTGTMTVSLYTYSDVNATVQVGSVSTKQFTITVPNNEDTKPYCSTMTVSPVSNLGASFAGLYIQGISKVKVASTDVGKYGATVVWKSVRVEGVDYGSSNDYTSNHLLGYGNVSVKLTIKDSRGITNSKTETITVIPYSKPRVVPVTGEASVVCGRCDSSGNWSDSGTYLKIKAGRSYSLCMSGGVQKNFCGLRYRYKKVADSDYGDWVTLLSITNTATEEVITSPLLNGALSAQTSYMVQVDAVDSIPNHTPVTFTIPTDKVYLHKAGSKNSLGIGEYVEESNTVSIAENIAVKVKNSINGVFMGTKVVSGVSSFDIQTKYADFTSTSGNERQTMFIFGAANASLVYGVARVSNNGTTQWQGTTGVELSTKSGGILTVSLPTTAYDLFTIISSRKFTL